MSQDAALNLSVQPRAAGPLTDARAARTETPSAEHAQAFPETFHEALAQSSTAQRDAEPRQILTESTESSVSTEATESRQSAASSEAAESSDAGSTATTTANTTTNTAKPDAPKKMGTAGASGDDDSNKVSGVDPAALLSIIQASQQTTPAVPKAKAEPREPITEARASAGDRSQALAHTGAGEPGLSMTQPDQSSLPMAQSADQSAAQFAAQSAAHTVADDPGLIQASPEQVGMHLASPKEINADSLPSRVMMTGLHEPGFPRALDSQLRWMVQDGIQSARLILQPESLGPVEVRLQIQNQQAQLSFLAQTPEAVAALRQSLPELRGLMDQSGISLSQAQVGQADLMGGERSGAGPGQDRQTATGQTADSWSGQPGEQDQGLQPPATGTAMTGRGLVNLYV